jgi:polysaccharide pyruvyl transferase WcaK-like protein
MTSRKLHVGFTGYYGMNNFGDDLFGAVCSAAAHAYWHAEPRVAGPAIAGVDVRYTMPHWYPASLYGATGALGKASRLYSFSRAIHDSDVLVMGGGSVINARESFRKPMMLSAHRRGKMQLAAVGVSIGPLENAAAEALVADFIDCFAYISVRDRRSYELATQMGLREKLHLGGDLAGLLPLLAPLSRTDAGPARRETIRIGVALCNYAEARGYATPDKRAMQSALVVALGNLARTKSLQIDVFSLNEHDERGDHALAQAFRQELHEQNVDARILRYRGMGPIAMAREIGRCDAFISARLHGAIVAYLQGVPFTIIDYHPKCNDFADDVGLDASQRITAKRQDTAAFEGAIDAMLGDGWVPTLSRELYVLKAQDIFKSAPWSTASQPRRAGPIDAERMD